MVLDGVELELRPGELTALVGASGSGKTTIARLLLRLCDPSAGEIVCGSTELRDIEIERWRAQIAWIPQRPVIFAGSVAENIRLGAPDASEHDVLAAVAAAGATEFIEALPDGLATLVGEGGRRLSAGQRQRIALARAFLRDAGLVILDEPTTHLDTASATAVGEAIARLARGRTTLLIVHDEALARRADRIVTLDAGRVVAPVLELAA